MTSRARCRQGVHIQREIADTAGLDANRMARALLAVSEVFGMDLPADTRFVEAVATKLHLLLTLGAKRSIAESMKG